MIGKAGAAQAPMVSFAIPIALAVSVSLLCLAVIYTVDWTPATRVKGVLTLVGLSYFVGVSLFFLNKEMVDRIRKFFGVETGWETYRLAGCEVKLPAHPRPLPDVWQPFKMAQFTGCSAFHKNLFGQYVFVIGSGKPLPPRNPNDPPPGTDKWFDKISEEIVNQAGQQISSGTIKYQDKWPGRELALKLADNGAIRIVRVYLVEEKAYYLSLEGPGLSAADMWVKEFFNSFRVIN
jgi:hypothetical protein